MTAVKTVKLGNLVTIKTGKLDANASASNGAYPFFTCSRNPLKIDTYSYDCKCVLVAGNGDLNIKYYEGKFDAYQRTYIIESIDEKKLDTQYLYHFLSKYVDKLRELSIGGVIKYIKLNNLTDPQIPLPRLEDQKRIVRELDAADALRQKRKQAIALLDDYLKAVFLEMFGDPVMNPKGWEVKLFTILCLKILGGGTPSKSNLDYYVGSIPWITPKDMKHRFLNDSEDHISEKAVKNSSVKLIPPKSVLMVIRSGILKHTLPVAINDAQVTINQDMKAYVIDSKISNPYFVLFFFEVYQNHLLKKVRAVTADNLKFDDIKNIETIVPPLELQKKFAEIVIKTENLKQKMLTQSAQFEANFNAMMQSFLTTSD